MASAEVCRETAILAAKSCTYVNAASGFSESVSGQTAVTGGIVTVAPATPVSALHPRLDFAAHVCGQLVTVYC